MTSVEGSQYSFSWNNHMTHIRSSLATLLNESVLIDVTLCCDGGRLSAHKMLLSMCSPYFRDVFKENPCPHPIVILKDVTCRVMESLLQFMYDGEVSVHCDDFASFMKTAKVLQVSGLTEEAEGAEEITNAVTCMKALKKAQARKKKTSDGAAVVKKKKQVELESSTSEIEQSASTSDNLNNETTVDTFTTLEINVKDEELLKADDNAEFMNEVEDLDTSPFVEQINTLPLGDGIQELDIKKVESLLEEGIPSASALHLHRCFSSTAAPKKAVVIKTSSPSNSTTRQYLCTICGKSFNHEKSYEQHKNVHIGRTKCPICNKVLCRKYQLKVHLEKQHKDKNISVDDIMLRLKLMRQKPLGKVRSFRHYKCSECDRAYGNEKSLQQHMWLHKGRTRCHICDKVLGRKYELKLHLKTTHGVKS